MRWIGGTLAGAAFGLVAGLIAWQLAAMFTLPQRTGADAWLHFMLALFGGPVLLGALLALAYFLKPKGGRKP